MDSKCREYTFSKLTGLLLSEVNLSLLIETSNKNDHYKARLQTKQLLTLTQEKFITNKIMWKKREGKENQKKIIISSYSIYLEQEMFSQKKFKTVLQVIVSQWTKHR